MTLEMDNETQADGGSMLIQPYERELSVAAKFKINKAKRAWGQAKELIIDAYNQLLDDGWTSLEAGDILRDSFKDLVAISERTLRAILPDEAKHQNMKRALPLPPPPKQEQEIAAGSPQIELSKPKGKLKRMILESLNHNLRNTNRKTVV